MEYRGIRAAVTGVLLLGLAGPLAAAELMPDFADVPTGWTTDRYDPSSFSNVGTYQGRDDVLGISISEAQGYGNRGGQDSLFYATQGRKHAISGGAGDSLSADLFVESDWATESNGTIRTDMWGTMDDNDAGTTLVYPIIGFTNIGDDARFRVWDGNIGWVDLAASVQFNEWNSLSMVFDGSDFIFSVNGVVAYTDTTTGGTTEFVEVIMQAYNFFGDDPDFPVDANYNPVAYTANWANVSAVPAPGTLVLAAAGLLAFGARRRRLH